MHVASRSFPRVTTNHYLPQVAIKMLQYTDVSGDAFESLVHEITIMRCEKIKRRGLSLPKQTSECL